MSLNWITDLEQKVESAARELETTRKENRTLKKKVQRLQLQLRETRSTAGAGATDDARAAWHKERRLIRRRVSNLADSLRKLL